MIDQTIVIPKASAQAIYELLLDSKKHSDLTGDAAFIDPQVGREFSAFSGYANGVTLALTPNKMIKQTWRASDWPEDTYSTIIFEFKDVESGAEIHFTQVDLPSDTEQEFTVGWQDNYWQPLLAHFA